MNTVPYLTEGEADTAPSLEDVVSRRTFVYAGVPVLEVPAGQAATCVSRLNAAAQALVVAAVTLEATGTVLAVVQAH